MFIVALCAGNAHAAHAGHNPRRAEQFAGPVLSGSLMRRAEGAPPGPSPADRPSPSRRVRLGMVAAPLVLLSVASATGNVLSPRLLESNPMMLAALSPRAIHLVVAAGAVPFPIFLAVGMLRLVAADPCHYLLGRMQGPAAAAAIERRSALLGLVARWLLRLDKRRAILAVAVSPTGKFLMLAGAGCTRPSHVALADAGGTLVRLTVLYASGRPLMQALDPSPVMLAIMGGLALAVVAGGPPLVGRLAARRYGPLGA